MRNLISIFRGTPPCHRRGCTARHACFWPLRGKTSCKLVQPERPEIFSATRNAACSRHGSERADPTDPHETAEDRGGAICFFVSRVCCRETGAGGENQFPKGFTIGPRSRRKGPCFTRPGLTTGRRFRREGPCFARSPERAGSR